MAQTRAHLVRLDGQGTRNMVSLSKTEWVHGAPLQSQDFLSVGDSGSRKA